MTTHPEKPAQPSPHTDASSDFIEKLRKALSRDGDFPASAKVVSELRQLTSDPKTTANQIAEIILREPSLGPRVLHMVNSSFYRRAKPIMTVSQAVIQIGMKPLAELCAGLVLLQKFIPAARRDSAFATCLQRTVLTSLLTSSIDPDASAAQSKADETGYLAGTFAELGTLLMAFYFPQVYEAAVKRSDTKAQPIAKSIHELTGLSPAQISIEIIDALQLPPVYKEILLSAESGDGTLSPSAPVNEKVVIGRVARSLYAGRAVSHSVTSGDNREKVDALLAQITKRAGITMENLSGVMGKINDTFKTHCTSLDLQLPALPEFVQSYAKQTDAGPEPCAAAPATQEELAPYIDEIRSAVEAHEPTASVITSVMETLAFGLKFDRVMLLLLSAGRRSLVGRMALGKIDGFDPRKFERPIPRIPEPHAPDIQAFTSARPVFAGDALLPDGWPLVALPIGSHPNTIGVIYADRVNSDKDLTGQEQAALGLMAELLERSVSENK